MNDKLIQIAGFVFLHKAYLLKEMLEEEGIEANVSTQSLKFIVKVFVHEKDREKASEIVDKLNLRLRDEQIDAAMNYEINHVLVPVDFTMHSEVAAKYALALAEKFSARLSIYHSFYIPTLDALPIENNYTFQGNIEEHFLQLEKEAKAKMASFSASIEKINQGYVKTETVIERGLAEDNILAYVDNLSADMVVIGANPDRKNASYIEGSLTRTLAESAKVPVFVIPGKANFTGIDEIDTILFLTNFDESDALAIKKLMAFSSKIEAKILVTHITEEIDKPELKIQMDQVKKIFSDEYPDQKVEFNVIESKDILKCIDDFSRVSNSDIVAVTTHKKGIIQKIFQPGLTNKLLFSSRTPLLVFHA